jgi:hypothetical protein
LIIFIIISIITMLKSIFDNIILIIITYCKDLLYIFHFESKCYYSLSSKSFFIRKKYIITIKVIFKLKKLNIFILHQNVLITLYQPQLSHQMQEQETKKNEELAVVLRVVNYHSAQI